MNFTRTTDASGFFTVTANTNINDGTYNWRVKRIRSLATIGTLNVVGGTSNPEMGLQAGGDGNNNNVVNTSDFTILRNTYGKSLGDPGYDARADFNNDNVVSTNDFNLIKGNFGQSGAGTNCP